MTTATATAFDFQRTEDGTLPLEAAVYQALSAAVSRSESDHLGDIGDRLVEFIRVDDIPPLLAELGRLREGVRVIADELWALPERYTRSYGHNGDRVADHLSSDARDAGHRLTALLKGGTL